MPPTAATRGALVNPQYKWEPHPRLLDPTTISAQGARMGLQAPEGCCGLAPKQVRIGSPKNTPRLPTGGGYGHIARLPHGSREAACSTDGCPYGELKSTWRSSCRRPRFCLALV